jgi:hypothetical protein
LQTDSQRDEKLSKYNMAGSHTLSELIKEYLTLTRETMPQLAKQAADKHSKSHIKPWPIKHDHCFQRIVLDNICGDAWYSVLKKPAYKHLNTAQANAAVVLCHQIIAGEVDLAILNERSLQWRKKQGSFDFG